MKKIYALFILHLITFYLKAQPPDTLFQYTFGGTNDEVARKIIATSDTGYLVVGSTSSFGHGLTDIYIIKIDSIGNRQWSFVYGTEFIDLGYSVRETYDGFIIVGTTNRNVNYDALCMKLDLNGQFLWQQVIGGSDWDFSYDIESTPDSGFIICGSTYSNSNGGSDIYAVRVNAAGSILWEKKYGGINDESGNVIIRDYENNYVIVGKTNTYGQGDNDFYLVKIDINGDTTWTRTIGGNKFDSGYGVDIATDSNYLIIGTTFSYPNDASDSSGNILYAEIDKTGGLIWQKISGGNENEEGRFINRLTDGNIMIGGMTESFGQGAKDIVMYYVDANGGNLNSTTRGGASDDEGFSATIGKSNQYFVAGSTNSFGCGLLDYYLIRKQIFPFIAGFQIELDTLCDNPLITVEENTENVCFVNAYPNPTHNDFSINMPCFENDKNIIIKIFDVVGREIRSDKVYGPVTTFSRSEFENGIYFISIQTGNHILSGSKLIVY
jgi:hypothetical protein